MDLPQGKGSKAEGLTAPLTISIDKNEVVTIAGQVFDKEALNAFLRESPRIKAGEAVYVEADEETRHKTLVKVMTALYEAGALKMNIIVKTPES